MRFSHHPFTLRQLQYAVAVAEARSFRRGAERCHVSQPALSAQIALLEDVLGARLFERATKLAITPAGETFLARARELLERADALADSAQVGADPFARTLRFGVIPTIAPYLLPEAAPALRARHPRLQIVWVEEKTPVLRGQLENGELDALIVARESALGDVAQAEIGADEFVLATAPSHPLAQSAQPVALDALSAEPVLLLDDGHCLRDQVLTLCTQSGAAEHEMRATSLATLVQMVAGGAGVTLLPALALEAETRGGGLALRRIAAPAPARTLVLAWRKSAPLAATLGPLARELGVLLQRITSRRPTLRGKRSLAAARRRARG